MHKEKSTQLLEKAIVLIFLLMGQYSGAEASDNIFFVSNYSPKDKSREIQNFVEVYQAECGEVPDSVVVLFQSTTGNYICFT